MSARGARGGSGIGRAIGGSDAPVSSPVAGGRALRIGARPGRPCPYLRFETEARAELASRKPSSESPRRGRDGHGTACPRRLSGTAECSGTRYRLEIP